MPETDLAMAFQRIVERRCSVRSYLPERPDRATILELVRLATLAPNSCNLQLYEFVYVDDPGLLARLKRVATGKLGWAPACFVVLHDPSFGVARQAALQGLAASVENLLLAAAARGLGTCWMAGFVNDEKVKQILGIPGRFELTGLITIGHPRDLPERPYRRRPDEVLSFNGYQVKPRMEFPRDPDVDRWSVEQVVEYRRRIAPVYAPRFHLASFPEDVTLAIVDLLQEVAPEARHEQTGVLDVVTYDGSFARVLEGAWGLGDRLTISDYFRYPLDNLKNVLPAAACADIDTNHSIRALSRESQGLITCINKLECLPRPAPLLKELFRVVRPGGRLFVTSALPYAPNALRKRLAVKRRGGNCYEKNQLYRAGPFHFRDPRRISSWIEQAGFTIEASGMRIPRRSERSQDLRGGMRPVDSWWRNLLGGQWLWWCVARRARGADDS